MLASLETSCPNYLDPSHYVLYKDLVVQFDVRWHCSRRDSFPSSCPRWSPWVCPSPPSHSCHSPLSLHSSRRSSSAWIAAPESARLARSLVWSSSGSNRAPTHSLSALSAKGHLKGEGLVLHSYLLGNLNSGGMSWLGAAHSWQVQLHRFKCLNDCLLFW